MYRRILIPLLPILFLACRNDKGAATEGVEQTLDALHHFASEANGESYFSLFTDDAVFLGTDATERWPIAEFREYALARFNTGVGWTYKPKKRFIYFDSDESTAWFDEVVINENYGECRGTGVLEKQGEKWRISHYNLTVPVPNDLLGEVVQMIKEQKKSK